MELELKLGVIGDFAFDITAKKGVSYIPAGQIKEHFIDEKSGGQSKKKTQPAQVMIGEQVNGNNDGYFFLNGQPQADYEIAPAVILDHPVAQKVQ